MIALHQKLAKIYHATQGKSLDEFAQQSLAQLKALFQFSQVCWFIYHQNAQTPVASYQQGFSERQLVALTPLLSQSLKRQAQSVATELQPPGLLTFTGPGKDLTFPHLYQVCFHDVRHYLLFDWPDAISAEAQSQLEWLLQPLISAYHQCLMAKMSRHWRYLNSHKALYDRYGNLLQAQAGYLEALAIHGLPEGFNSVDFASLALPTKFDCHNSKKIEISETQGLYLAQLYQPDELIEALTATEKKVARLIVQSNTAKTIATALGISKRTAEQHINNIRQKLDVDTIEEVLMVLIHSDYCFNGEVFG